MELREVAHAQRHRAAPGGAFGGVGEANQPFAARVLEQLDEGREAPRTCPLLERHLVDDHCLAPRSRRLRALR
jgi:hypothetical protein